MITQSYFKVPKGVMKSSNKREIQEIGNSRSSDIYFKHFMKIYKEDTAESYSVLVSDTAPLSDNSLLFRENLLE